MPIDRMFGAGLLILLFASPALSDQGNVKDRAYALLMDDILHRKIQVDFGSSSSGNQAGEENRYRDRRPEKVLAACIAWAGATSSSIPVKHWNSIYGAHSILNARDEALTFCRSKGSTDCDCQIVDENDQNVLQVPPSYPSKPKS